MVTDIAKLEPVGAALARPGIDMKPKVQDRPEFN